MLSYVVAVRGESPENASNEGEARRASKPIQAGLAFWRPRLPLPWGRLGGRPGSNPNGSLGALKRRFAWKNLQHRLKGPRSAATRDVTTASRPSTSTITSPGSKFGAGCSRSPSSSPERSWRR